MKETIKRLEIAFMGYDTQQTKAAFQRFARDNQEEIRTDAFPLLSWSRSAVPGRRDHKIKFCILPGRTSDP